MRRLLLLALCFGLLSAGFASGGSDGFKVEAAQRSRPRRARARVRSRPPAPSPAEIAARRKMVHELMLNGEYLHDGAGELLYIGDITSVPALLRVLKDNPPIKNYDGEIGIICTTAHALQALRKITKHDAGYTYEAWSTWWELYQKEIPRK